MPIRAENRDRYPKDWALRSRFVRHVRARGRCEWCGAHHGAPHPYTGAPVVLTTAHVHDKRPEAASLLNLAALCQRCHNRHDAAERKAGRTARRHAHQAVLPL
jgi:5-methylcytosine-specific restriction endonuclease McrA